MDLPGCLATLLGNTSVLASTLLQGPETQEERSRSPNVLNPNIPTKMDPVYQGPAQGAPEQTCGPGRSTAVRARFPLAVAEGGNPDEVPLALKQVGVQCCMEVWAWQRWIRRKVASARRAKVRSPGTPSTQQALRCPSPLDAFLATQPSAKREGHTASRAGGVCADGPRRPTSCPALVVLSGA